MSNLFEKADLAPATRCASGRALARPTWPRCFGNYKSAGSFSSRAPRRASYLSSGATMARRGAPSSGRR
jgi:hypothetical protein